MDILEQQNTFWGVLNEDFTLLLLGFLLTGLVGAFLSASYQKKAWLRETKLELFKKRYDDGIKLMENLGSLVERRYFATQQFLWTLESRITIAKNIELIPANTELSETQKEHLKKQLENQLSHLLPVLQKQADVLNNIADEWNGNLRTYRAKIKLLVGEDFANQFAAKTESGKTNLHDLFKAAHDAVLATYSQQGSLNNAQHAINLAENEMTNFIERLTKEFLQKTPTMKLLNL